jgi:hypothetical protein
MARDWDHKAGRRFFELVEREAKNIATAQEIKESEGLSNLRRQFDAPRTGGEVFI